MQPLSRLDAWCVAPAERRFSMSNRVVSGHSTTAPPPVRGAPPPGILTDVESVHSEHCRAPRPG